MNAHSRSTGRGSRETRPDLILILPSNLYREVSEHLSYMRDWSGRLAVAPPKLEVW